MLRKVVPNFNEDAWTSTYRKHVFPDRPIPKVQPGIPGKPDFVFQDESGILAGLLLEDRASQAKTFCLEVKTSPDTPRAFATESQSKAVHSSLLVGTKIERSLIYIKPQALTTNRPSNHDDY